MSNKFPSLFVMRNNYKKYLHLFSCKILLFHYKINHFYMKITVCAFIYDPTVFVLPYQTDK